MKRKIILIDEELCNGCGLCIPNCPEGALQIIDDKVRLVSDLFCDGLGACLGHCPEGAITVEEREAEPYDERKVMENIVKQGENVIRAHLKHLKEHGETGYLNEALSFLKEKNLESHQPYPPSGMKTPPGMKTHAGCPGARVIDFSQQKSSSGFQAGGWPSELRQWPVQLHLLPASAPYLEDSDLLLCADCAAYAAGDFHKDYLKGKTLAIACPKLDSGQEIYLEKLTSMIDFAKIKSITVMTMEVPCCRGLLELARRAVSKADRKIPINWIMLGIQGEIIQEEAVSWCSVSVRY